MFNKKVNTNSKIFVAIMTLLLIVGVSFSFYNSAGATGVLQSRSLELSNSAISANNVNYTFKFQITTTYILGSLSFDFCSNSPIESLPCTPISGFDASGAIVIAQSGISGLSVAPGSTSNHLILTRSAANTVPGFVTIELGGINNPNVLGTNFGRIQTFNSTNGSGSAIDAGGTTFSITNPLSITTEVPPYLYLCVGSEIIGYTCDASTGSFVNLGEFDTNSARTGTSQFVVATNAGSGFFVVVTGTAPTSGNNVIPALSSQSPSLPGQSQFGMNLRANSNPGVGIEPVGAGTGFISAAYNSPNLFKFNSGDTVVSSPTTSTDRKFTVSYIVNVNSSQEAGVYNTTLLYTALASF